MYRIKDNVSPHIAELIKQMRIRGLSEKTILVYAENIEYFFKYYRGKKPKDLSIKDINNYQYYLCHKKRHKASYVNSQTAAIKFYCRYVLKRDWDWRIIPYMKDKRKLPVIISRDDIKTLLSSSKNIKHRAIITTLYATGIRPIELTNLKTADIQSKEKVIHIRHGKGDKDRYVMLSDQLLKVLRQYWLVVKPDKEGYLFEGEKPGSRLNVDSVSTIFRRLKQESKIAKKAYCYSLRHSFATHLLEDGTDIRVIQKLMGHSDISTTVRYLQVAKSFVASVKSPLDTLSDPR